MNKLINELAQKAEDYADDTDLPWLATYTEKFANLLIEDMIANVKVWEKDSRNHISYMLRNHYVK